MASSPAIAHRCRRSAANNVKHFDESVQETRTNGTKEHQVDNWTSNTRNEPDSSVKMKCSSGVTSKVVGGQINRPTTSVINRSSSGSSNRTQTPQTNVRGEVVRLRRDCDILSNPTAHSRHENVSLNKFTPRLSVGNVVNDGPTPVGLKATGGREGVVRGSEGAIKALEKANDPNDEVETTDRMKTKLLSVWNNVKYGWTVRIKTNFSRDTPIWFLGQCYHHKLKDDVGTEFCGLAYGMDGFKQDFVSRIWFTYRREFPTLAGSAYTTDCGWGCMLRSGQMMLAQALVCHFLGRAWRWQTSSPRNELIHRTIVRWFGDLSSKTTPFSLHRLVGIGESSGKKAGDWYGPASVAHIIKQSLEICAREDPLLSDICVYVAQDCTVYKKDVLSLCGSSQDEDCHVGASVASSRTPKGVIILVPVRLGGEVLNPIYFKCVQAILSNEHCIGIIGGRPRHSLYFVGWQEDKLIHLDPHYCQEAVDVRSPDFPLQSFHCMSPRKLSFSRMDPSCTIGFYCRTRADVLRFLASCNEVLTPPHPQADYPVFVVAENSEQNHVVPYGLVQSLSCDQSFAGYSGDGQVSEDEDYEEFVFL